MNRQKREILVGGLRVKTGVSLAVKNPFDGEIVAEVCRAGTEEAARALEIAHNARGVMARMPSHRKADVLRAVSETILRRKDEMAQTITLECGKPIREASTEVERASLTFRIASEEAQRVGGEMIPLDRNSFSEGRWGITRRFPLGPVLGLTPFNFPLNLVAHKVAPAIASGNPIIVKPSSRTPLSALLLGEIVLDAGLPPEGISVLPCSTETAEQILLDPRIRVLSFTGSASVGWSLKQKSPEKKVLLELGGNAGVIIDERADLDYAAKRCVAGAFSYAGQVCISVQRIYVHEAVYDAFLDLFLRGVGTLRIGDPLSPDTDIGPMIDDENIKRVEAWVAEATAKGAKVLTGGRRKGNFYEPTVLADTSPEMKVSCKEVFAPVVTVAKIRDFQEGLGAVNDTVYGLQAGVFTQDIRNAFSAFETIEAGGVIINDVPAYRVDHMPYGGVKRSGFGREGVRYAIEEMTEIRLMVVNPR
jgi:acyl-CoA reductase-like NAD-dependent aldehyde dehydrogenase